ncbi:uncharacterized protein LOC134608798 [Pelobates fuscus]|uniref:uncharacterized protein LOC134608798 n=1 Tax=Pelobates fuscus TaxID=191477 RepID=UPI002FE4CD36
MASNVEGQQFTVDGKVYYRIEQFILDPDRKRPLIGFQSFVELVDQRSARKTYKCTLCGVSALGNSNIIYHFLGIKHRKRYIAMKYPNLLKYISSSKKKASKKDNFTFVEKKIEMLEGTCKFMNIATILSKEPTSPMTWPKSQAMQASQIKAEPGVKPDDKNAVAVSDNHNTINISESKSQVTSTMEFVECNEAAQSSSFYEHNVDSTSGICLDEEPSRKEASSSSKKNQPSSHQDDLQVSSSSNTLEHRPRTLTSDMLRLIKGKDVGTVLQILQHLAPHYSSLQDVDLELFAEILSQADASV